MRERQREIQETSSKTFNLFRRAKELQRDFNVNPNEGRPTLFIWADCPCPCSNPNPSRRRCEATTTENNCDIITMRMWVSIKQLVVLVFPAVPGPRCTYINYTFANMHTRIRICLDTSVYVSTYLHDAITAYKVGIRLKWLPVWLTLILIALSNSVKTVQFIGLSRTVYKTTYYMVTLNSIQY